MSEDNHLDYSMPADRYELHARYWDAGMGLLGDLRRIEEEYNLRPDLLDNVEKYMHWSLPEEDEPELDKTEWYAALNEFLTAWAEAKRERGELPDEQS